MSDLIKNKTILTGSSYFFSDYPDYYLYNHDIDKLELVDYPVNFKHYQQISLKNKDIFRWVKLPPEEMIAFEFQCKCPMQIAKYLSAEFSKQLNFTIEHLKQLKPIVDKMDDKHSYLAVIYYYYLENNSFTLTQEQRDKAYEEYKSKRLDRLEKK